jgi:ribosomal protein L40E
MLFSPDTEFWQNPTLILILHAQNGSKLLLEVSGMTSEKKVCGSCNAIDDSDAEFCRECGTALPPLPTNSSELLAQAKIALARADYKGVLRACAAAKLLDPNNAEVSQIMAAAHAALDVLRGQKPGEGNAALDVLRDQKPGEGNAANVQDSNSYRNKSNTRKLFNFIVVWGAIGMIVITVFAIINALDDDETSSTSSSNNSSTNQQSDRTGSNSPELSATKVPIVQYQGCDGLADLIPKLKSIGGSSLGYYQLVQFGDNAICDDTIAKLNKPELLKD